jgi:hypothetical protein
MSKKITVKGCPCCGEKAYWCKANRDIRMYDRVQCLSCSLEVEGDYTPQSAVEIWNHRVLDHYCQDTVYNIDGDQIQ